MHLFAIRALAVALALWVLPSELGPEPRIGVVTNNVNEVTAPKHGYTDQEVFVLAATVWGEARGEGLTGMRAVAHVIKNRVAAKNPNFGFGIEGVAKKRHQFSCWNGGDANCALLTETRLNALNPNTKDGIAWKHAKALARLVLNGGDADPTKGAIFYHTKAVSPFWAEGRKITAQIGAHVFYS